jgi:hypothetical protein
LLLSRFMKLTLFALLGAFFISGCTNTLYTHRKDFRPTGRKGPWNDYYVAVKRGEEPPVPKEREKK